MKSLFRHPLTKKQIRFLFHFIYARMKNAAAISRNARYN